MPAPRLEEAWNSRSGETVGAAYTRDGVRHEFAMPGARLEGRAAITEQVSSYMRALPDCRLEIRTVAETSDGAVVEWTFRGTHTGDLPGLPAQGEEVVLEGVSVCRMEGDLIREERVYWDAAMLLIAAGVVGPA